MMRREVIKNDKQTISLNWNFSLFTVVLFSEAQTRRCKIRSKCPIRLRTYSPRQ